MVHVYSTLIGGLLAGAATAVCSNKKGRKGCMNDESCGWQKLATVKGTEKNCVAVEPEANPGMCETETAKLETKVGKQKKQINNLKARIAKLKNGSGSGSPWLPPLVPCDMPDPAEIPAETYCGKGDGSSVHPHGCKNMPDALVAGLFGKGCSDLKCNGSGILDMSGDPNDTIKILIRGWCPAKCGGCGDFCKDKPWLLEANNKMFGTPSTCEAYSVPEVTDSWPGGAWDLDTETELTDCDSNADCDDLTVTTGCCWYAGGEEVAGGGCEPLFRMACPSMSGICEVCPERA